MIRKVCDYCGEMWPQNIIRLTRTPNDEEAFAELCDVCLADILRASR